MKTLQVDLDSLDKRLGNAFVTAEMLTRLCQKDFEVRRGGKGIAPCLGRTNISASDHVVCSSRVYHARLLLKPSQRGSRIE